jgi:large subunit ribosomal protein L35
MAAPGRAVTTPGGTPARHFQGNEDHTMPKSKTHSGTAKRFKVTGTGRLRHERAGRRHLLEKKPSKLTRRLKGTNAVAGSDVKKIRKLLGR